MKKMIDSFGDDNAEVLVREIPDDALERAACIVTEGGVYTVAFWSGLDTCPAQPL